MRGRGAMGVAGERPDTQIGLIAEKVEKVNRDLIVYSKDGKVLSARYDAVDVMVLNEFLKAQKNVLETVGQYR